MIIKVYLKDPDGFSESVADAVGESLADAGLDGEEFDAAAEARTKKVWAALDQWVEYDECVEIEFDTVAKTATVTPRVKR